MSDCKIQNCEETTCGPVTPFVGPPCIWRIAVESILKNNGVVFYEDIAPLRAFIRDNNNKPKGKGANLSRCSHVWHLLEQLQPVLSKAKFTRSTVMEEGEVVGRGMDVVKLSHLINNWGPCRYDTCGGASVE